ncbi:MAG: UPF0280 family protein [Deltaproteobacteria bacterium]|nr:UPF0280 family protein [Deltaproteobacteria bacterium]
MDYRERTYRNKVSKVTLTSFPLQVKETDLYISADRNLDSIARKSVYKYRKYIEEYILHHPSFLNSLIPVDRDDFAPPVIQDMIEASIISGVGPMAAVAGAIAQYVGTELLLYSRNVIVENGGDIFLKCVDNDARVALFAGESPLSYKISLRIKPEDTPIGICTSSGTVGHSLSLGIADAVCVTSKSTALADAAATYLCNLVKGENDIKKVLDLGFRIKGVLGIVIIINDKIGAVGAVELT